MANFLYEKVTDKIIDWIETGTLEVGEKLPSLRKFSRQEGVSLSTIMEAYARLESRGWIQARPQSGYYVKTNSLQHFPEPDIQTPRASIYEVGMDEFITQYLSAFRKEHYLKLGSSNLPAELLPTTKIYNLLAKFARQSKTNAYGDLSGDPRFRKEIARLSNQRGTSLSPDDILVTCGCTESLSLAIRAVAEPGDIIAVESPTYFGTLQTIEGLGMRVLEVGTHARTGLEIEHLEELLETYPIKAILTIATFQNPLGVSIPEDRKKQLVELVSAYNIPIIEDDIFGEFYFSQHPPRTLKAYDTEGLVMLCSSVSKTIAPGFRIGWIAPGKFWKRVSQLKRMSTHSTVLLPQKACAEFMASGGFDRHMKKLRRTLERQLSFVNHAIREYFPAGTKMTRPTGGSVCWIELPANINALNLYEQAQHHDILIAPGPLFSVKRAYQNFIRLSFGQVWGEEIDRALYLLGALMKESE